MLSSDNFKYGYNAATGNYEDLMAAGIIDPTKVSCFIEIFSGRWGPQNGDYCVQELSPLYTTLSQLS